MAGTQGGAAVDARGNDDSQPLHRACAGGHLEVVQWWVSKGAAIDATAIGGTTGTQFAEKQGHHQVVAPLRLKRMTRHRATKQPVIKPVVVSQEEARQAEKDRQQAEQELLAMIEGAEGEG